MHAQPLTLPAQTKFLRDNRTQHSQPSYYATVLAPTAALSFSQVGLPRDKSSYSTTFLLSNRTNLSGEGRGENERVFLTTAVRALERPVVSCRKPTIVKTPRRGKRRSHFIKSVMQQSWAVEYRFLSTDTQRWCGIGFCAPVPPPPPSPHHSSPFSFSSMQLMYTT